MILSNITKTKQELSPLLSPEQSQVVKSSRGKKIKEMSDLDVKLDLTKALDNAYVNINAKSVSSNPDRIVMQDQLVKALLLNFSNMTMEEVALAIFKGSLGDFKEKSEDVIYISPKSVCEWIRAYVEKVKKDAISKQLKWEENHEKKLEPTEEEQEAIVKSWMHDEIVVKYKQSQKEGKLLIEDPHNIIYNILTNPKRGIWKPTGELKINAYKKQRERFISTAKKGTYPKSEWYAFDEFRKEDFDSEPNEVKQNNGFFTTCTSKAKDQMIHDLFTGMLDMEEDIEEFLNSKSE